MFHTQVLLIRQTCVLSKTDMWLHRRLKFFTSFKYVSYMFHIYDRIFNKHAHVSRTCPIYFKHVRQVSDLCQTCLTHISDMFHTYVRHVPDTCQTCYALLSDMFFKHDTCFTNLKHVFYKHETLV